MQRLKSVFRHTAINTALSLALLGLLISSFNALQPVDRLVYDSMLRLWPRPATDGLVIIEIDERSLKELGRWPWSRRTHAKLLDTLTQLNAAAIGLDIIFAEPENADPVADRLLAEAIRHNGKVVLPVLPEITGLRKEGIKPTLPLKQFIETAAGLGHVDIELDSDGLVRSIFLEAGFDNRKWRSFASVLLQVHHEDHTLKWQGESRPNTHPSRSNLWWRNQRVLIPFADNSEFQRISYLDILQEKTTDLSLENKIVLVGASAAGLATRFPTPLSGQSEPMNGIELHAQVLNSGLQGFNLIQLSKPLENLLTFILLFATLISSRIYNNKPLIPLLAGMISAIATSASLFYFALSWFSPVAVLTVLILSFPALNWQSMKHIGRTLLFERQRNSATLAAIGDAIIITDSEGRIEFLNPNAEILTGFTLQEASHRHINTVLIGLSTDQAKFWSPSLLLKSDKPVSTCYLKAPNGNEYTIRLSCNPIDMPIHETKQYMFVLSDITETVKMSRRWKYLATHDKLTGLPNRIKLEELIDRNIADEKDNNCFAICFIGFDDLKTIDETLSLSAEDFLISAIAKRLKTCIRIGDSIGRWSNDEFIIIFNRTDDKERIAILAQEIISVLTLPYPYLQDIYSLLPRMGISLYPHDGETAKQLLTKADAARNSVRKHNTPAFCFYSSSKNTPIPNIDQVLELSSVDQRVDNLSPDDQQKLEAIRLRNQELKKTIQSAKSSSKLKRLLSSPFKKT
ncbi:CHASE2 domain-containing protein [Methylotuvimicrobium sp. KM1]|uniref:CHASE2 domain-containing protein n=1 Tax=Methylotuvimicrobium sp. KM1 TaxID=3377707 RepID=UPI0038510A7E